LRFKRGERTDLVISMTLAEIFLLLMFIMWFGYLSIPDSPAENAWLKEKLNRIQDENEELSKLLTQANNEISDLKKRLEFWRVLTGFETPPTQTAFTEWIKDASRGNPKCEENNVLIHVTVLESQISISLITESSRLSNWYLINGLQLPKVGEKIIEYELIETFLSTIRTFYSVSNPDGSECRFDYNMTYGSKEDYFDGRQLFERYFYPASIIQFSSE